MTDKAIEAAARALSDSHLLVSDGHYTLAVRAAVIAYLRNVEVSDGTAQAGRKALCDQGVDNVEDTDAPAAFKAMCAAKADELEASDD